MLTQKAAKTVANTVAHLVESGWEICSHESRAVVKNNCYVYFDQQDNFKSEFNYSNGTPAVLSLALIDKIDKATWHAEYKDSVVAFGKIPATFSSEYKSMTEQGKVAADEFIATLEDVAKGAQQRQALGICSLVCTISSATIPYFKRINSLEEIEGVTILAGEKPGTEFYSVVKDTKNQGVFFLIRVTLQQEQTNYQLIVTPEAAKEFSAVTEDTLTQLIAGGKYYLYNVCDTHKEIQIYNWTQSKYETKDITKNIYDLIPSLVLDKEQEYYVNLAYENNYDLSQILSYDYNASTLRWLIQFMKLRINSHLIKANYDDAVMSMLYKLTIAGYPIQRYLNTTYTVDDIENQHSAYLNDVAELKVRLKNKNYKEDTIKAISYIYAYRSDLSHVMYNEPAAKIYLRDYLLDGYSPLLANFLLNTGDVQGALVTCSSAALPPELLQEAKNYIHCDVMVDNVPWDEYVCSDRIAQLYFRQGTGIVVETAAGSVYHTENSLVLSKDSYKADARVINIGGELLVEH